MHVNGVYTHHQGRWQVTEWEREEGLGWMEKGGRGAKGTAHKGTHSGCVV